MYNTDKNNDPISLDEIAAWIGGRADEELTNKINSDILRGKDSVVIASIEFASQPPGGHTEPFEERAERIKQDWIQKLEREKQQQSHSGGLGA